MRQRYWQMEKRGDGETNKLGDESSRNEGDKLRERRVDGETSRQRVE